MVPPTVDNLSLSLPELSIPSVTPSRAADRGDGPSFQDALARVGESDRSAPSPSRDASRTNGGDSAAASSSPSSPDKKGPQFADDSQTSGRAAEKQPAAQETNESQDTDQTKPNDADDVEQGTPPVVTDEKGKDDSDHEDRRNPDQAATIAAAVAAAQAKTNASAAPGDEITLSDAAQERSEEPIAAAKPVGGKADVPPPTPVVQKSQQTADDVPTPITATEQVVASAAATDVTSIADEAPIIADDKPRKSTTVVGISKAAANAVHAAAPMEKSIVAASEKESVETPEAAASAAPPEQESSNDKRSGRSDDKSTTTDRSANVTTTTADLSLSQTTAGDAVQTAEAVAAAVTTTITGEATDRSDGSGDARKTADSGRQPDIAGIRHPAAGVEGTRHANSRNAAAVGTLVDQAGAGGLSQGDRVRLVQRVARAVQTAQERGGDLQLRLSPPELGSLRLQVKMTDGALTARLEAETPQARQVLADSMPQLRERLAEQNIRVERFDVDLMQSGGGGPSNLPDRRQDASQDGLPSRGGAAARRELRGDANVGGASPTRLVAAGRLDITA